MESPQEKVVNYLVKSIARYPDAVQTSTSWRGSEVSTVHVTCDAVDYPLIIGKRGRNIDAVRTVITSLYGNCRISVESDRL